jgi:membrane protein required for colicin V production
MEGFTLIDAVVAGVVLISAILAYARGFVREALAIAGWMAAAVVAFIFAPQVEPLVTEVPVLGDFLADSCELSLIAAFAGLFAVALIVVSLFTPFFAGAVQGSALSGIDQGLGFLFGVLRGFILVALAFVVYDRVMVNQEVAMVDDSRSVEIFAATRDAMEEQIPQEAPQWIVERYEEFVSVCAGQAGGTPAPEAPAAEETPEATDGN